MKHDRFFFLFVLLAVLVSACGQQSQEVDSSAQSSQEGTITISGAFALYPMMQRWAEEYTTLNADVQFDISAGGAGKGMTDTLAGAVDIGMVSRSVTPEEEEQGAFWVPVVKDAVFPMVNAANPVLADLLEKGVTRAIFEKIYISGEITSWGEVVGNAEAGDTINIYTRSDAAGAPEVWAKYLGKKQEDLLGLGVFGDPGLLDAVIKDVLGIGYNNLGYAYDNASGALVAGSMVVPIDVNENGVADPEEVLETKAEAIAAVASGQYPSPPARPLNLVTKGAPTPLVQAFIAWVLTAGQQYVGEAGYVQLTQDQLDEAIAKIK
jgi:phosphate transport system substrate-binding protein